MVVRLFWCEPLLEYNESYGPSLYKNVILHINSGPYWAMDHKLIIPDLQYCSPIYKVSWLLDQKSLNL